MHTILGAGGPISNAVSELLNARGEAHRLISRNPIQNSGLGTWTAADLKDYASLSKAAKGASVLYMCAGLKYDRAVWNNDWPMIMSNIIRLAKETGARLIFFDNVYMYGLVQGPMTEETPYNPNSVKGEIRAAIATQLMDEAKSGNIKASIARSADFYGYGGANSVLDSMVIKNLSQRKSAQWLGDIHKKHSYTFVADAGKAMTILGQNPESDNQIWHIPTAPALMGTELVALIARKYHVAPKSMKLNKLMLRMVGLFNTTVREVVEMYYQYDHDYIFDSSKFEKRFQVQPTSYEDGIAQVF